MPRNVRNFWLELRVDGRATVIQAGPRAKNGGFHLTIKQRDEGNIVTSMIVTGIVTERGHLQVRASRGAASVAYETSR